MTSYIPGPELARMARDSSTRTTLQPHDRVRSSKASPTFVGRKSWHHRRETRDNREAGVENLERHRATAQRNRPWAASSLRQQNAGSRGDEGECGQACGEFHGAGSRDEKAIASRVALVRFHRPPRLPEHRHQLAKLEHGAIEHLVSEPLGERTGLRTEKQHGQH